LAATNSSTTSVRFERTPPPATKTRPLTTTTLEPNRSKRDELANLQLPDSKSKMAELDGQCCDLVKIFRRRI
jgi:hypothetical protein